MTDSTGTVEAKPGLYVAASTSNHSRDTLAAMYLVRAYFQPSNIQRRDAGMP